MQFYKEFIVNNINRAVVKFTHDGTAAALAGALTGSVNWGDYGFTLTGSTSSASQVDIGKIFWSISQNANPINVGVSWVVPGSMTGQPCVFLSGQGAWDLQNTGIKLISPLTGANRVNEILIKNYTNLVTGDTITILLELDKVKGFGITGATP